MFKHHRPRPPRCCPDLESECQLPERLRWLHDAHRHHHGQFLRQYRYFRFFRPVGLLLTLAILYVLFTTEGFKGFAVFFAVLIVVKELGHFFFLLRMERRIIAPMERLKKGLDEVAKGNYGVKVAYDRPSDLGYLIAAFNEMTAILAAGERMQAEYDASRKALVANISHDLKTPLTAIQGYVEALQEGKLASPEAEARYLQTIHSNIVYVNKLIDDLFLFSKLDMHKLELCCEAVRVKAFMGDLMEEYRFDCAERGVSFSYADELAADSRVSLDGKRIHQALNNILGNAVQHGPETGLAIAARLYRRDGYICVDIGDNGPGIPADKLPHIFDRFYRVDTERAKGANTGLGLAIARELIEAHGGRITVASAAGEGTRFTVMLPILAEGGDAL